MAFDETLAARVRKKIGTRKDILEKKMFGGIAFLLNGNMSVGIHGNELIVRVDPNETDKLLKQKGVKIFDITGRPMKGWLLVGVAGIQNGESLNKWIEK